MLFMLIHVYSSALFRYKYSLSLLIDYKFHFMYQHNHMYKITLTPSPRNMFINIAFIKQSESIHLFH